MKKILYTICLAAAPLFFQACDNLDLSPIDYNASGNYWQNETQVKGFVDGLHNDLRSQLNQQYLEYGELRGEIQKTSANLCGPNSKMGNYIINSISESLTLKSNWGGFYSKILQVNLMIEQLENGCAFLSDSKRNYYKGVAYGLRAYYYFWLYRSYGGVPLELTVKVTQGSVSAADLYMERASAEETLNQIKTDVNASLSAFDASSDKSANYYYWSKDASLMLKGEVYLWSAKVTTDDPKAPHTATGSTEDLTTAKNALNQLTGYSLESDFGKLFSKSGKKNNKEVILSLYMDKDEATSGLFKTYFYHPGFNGTIVVDEEGNELGQDPLNLLGSALQYEEYKRTLVDSYDKADGRRAATFFEFYRKEDLAFGCNMLKFFGHSDASAHYYDADIHLYRYADAILMLAEIENALTGKCATYINQIRERAYGENWSNEFAYVDGDYAANELAILKERDKEFVGEGKRWFDLLRLHDANKQPLVFAAEAGYAEEGMEQLPVLDKATESYKILWPIESSLMGADPLLTQTVNYPTVGK